MDYVCSCLGVSVDLRIGVSCLVYQMGSRLEVN
jgi:hypothetical protein